MHFSSFINRQTCKPGKISNLMSGHEIYKSEHKMGEQNISLTSIFSSNTTQLQVRFTCHNNIEGKLKFLPKIEDGTDLRRSLLTSFSLNSLNCQFAKKVTIGVGSDHILVTNFGKLSPNFSLNQQRRCLQSAPFVPKNKQKYKCIKIQI